MVNQISHFIKSKFNITIKCDLVDNFYEREILVSYQVKILMVRECI